MSCKVELNSQNKIVKVKDAQGDDSILFKSLVQNPHLSVDQALELYKNVFTDKFQGDEYPLIYKNTRGEEYNTFGEALRATKVGKIEAYSSKNLMFSIDSSTDSKTYGGFLNSMISGELLKGETFFDNGDQIFQVEGSTETMRAIKADMVLEESTLKLGGRNVKKLSNNNFQFTDKVGKVEMIDNSGKKVTVAQSELDVMTYEELDSKYKNSDDIIFDRELANDSRSNTYGGSKIIQEASETPNEGVLKTQLLTLLNNLGVTTMGISEYLEKYQIKNGVEPSAQALADIANRVIAFQGGEISLEDLTEETAHFIVEGWDIAQTENLLRNIHKSEEWAEFSEQYRQIYSQRYSGAELEQAIRKEVLGKVLANALKTQFSLENKNQTQSNFITNVMELLQSFFGRVQSLLKPQYLQDLNSFNDKVGILLRQGGLQGQLSDAQISASKFTLYSASQNSADNMAVLQATANKMVTLLEQTQTQMSKLKGLSSNKEALNRIKQNLEAITENNKIATFAGITASVKTQLKYLEQALNNSDKTKHPFGVEENVVYLTLTNQMRPVLEEIGGLLQMSNSDDRLIKKEVGETLLGIADLSGKVRGTDSSKALEYMVDELAIKYNWSQDTRDKYLLTLKAAKKDTNWAHAYFGGLAHAQNPILNMFGNLIKKITMQTSIDHRNITTDLVVKLQTLGVSQTTLNTLKRGAYLIDKTDWTKVDDKVNQIELEAYNDHQDAANPKIELKDYLRMKREGVLPTLTAQAYNDYRAQVKKELEPYLERPFTDAYYQKKAALYEKYSISADTQRWLSTISGDVSSVYERAKDASGTIVLTQALKFDLEQISKERAYAKSPFGNDGEYKQGLDGNINSEGKLDLFLLADPSPEAVRAYELEVLDKEFLKELKDRGDIKKDMPVKFIEEISKLEAAGDYEGALEYLKLNAQIGFSRDFWDSLAAGGSLTERLEAVEGENQDRALEIIGEMKLLQAKKANILKANRVLNQPSETDVERMSTTEKENLKSYSEELQSLYKEASTFFKKKEQDEVAAGPVSENTPNQSYYDALKAEGKEGLEVVDFIKSHTTGADKSLIEEAERLAARLRGGKPMNIPKMFQKHLNKDYSAIKDDYAREQVISKDLIAYAESRLLPYYVRFAPIGYESLMEDLEYGAKNKGSRKVSELLQEVIDGTSSVTITPNYSFFEAKVNNDLNKDFKRDFEGGRYQFKSSFGNESFVNTEFETMFGVKNGVPTRNQKLYEAREALINYHKDSLEAVGETNRQNLYKLPQQSKGGLKKLEAFKNEPRFGKIKEGLKDSFGYREEDIASGEVIKGGAGVEDMRIIPKYGMRELANQEDLSDELLSSYTWMHEQSVLHRARKENIGHALSLKEAVMGSDYGGKAAQATATYKMFQSYMDENFFGIKESYEKDIPIYKGYNVHLSKVLRMFGSFVRFRNLGFAIVSPLTSLVTAKTQFWLESKIGEHVNSASSSLARKEFRKLAGPAMSETLEINSQSRLNVLGEHFMMYEGDRRFANSSFSKFTRGLVQAPFATHSMANFPVMPTVMLSVLHDYRIVGGQVQTFNEYKKNNSGLTALEIKNTWAAAEDKTMYKYMDTKGGKFSYNLAELGPLLNKSGEELEKYVGLKNEAIFQRVSLVSQAIDGNISTEEKSMASRNLVLQLFLTHRNFLSLWTQKRFKGSHMSLETGQVESGSYGTLGRFIKGYAEQYKKGNLDSTIANMKQYWAGLEENEKLNMQRNGKDFIFVNAILALSLALSSFADDDDNKDLWSLQAGNYLALRLANESASTSYAIPLSYYDTVADLFVGLNSIPETLSFGDIGDDELVKSGKWTGFTKNERYFGRNTGFAKTYAEIVNTRKVKDGYELNNGAFKNFLVASWVADAAGVGAKEE
jgi:hypothetical protein